MLSHGIRVTENRALVNRFLSVYPDRFLVKHDLSNMFNELQSNCKIYYSVFNTNNDHILVIYKKISIHKVKFNRLLGFPISLSKNKSNEIKVLNMLKSSKSISEVVVSEHELSRHHLNSSNYDVCEYDFYYDIDSLISKIDTSKWRSKHSVTKYKNDLDVRLATLDDYDNLFKIHRVWSEYKGSDYRSKSLFKNYFKNFSTYCSSTYVVTYKGIPVSFNVFDDLHCVSCDRVCSKIIENHYNKWNVPSELDIPHQILSNISYITLYYTTKILREYGYSSFNVGNASSKSLQDFKRRYVDEEIKYYKIKFGGHINE